MIRLYISLSLAMLIVAGCSVVKPRTHTIADLQYVEPPLTEVDVTDSLDKALAGYQHYLQETPANRKTPEALRRMADLRLEREYGTLVGNEAALPEPDRATVQTPIAASGQVTTPASPAAGEDLESFEKRATEVVIEGQSIAASGLTLPDQTQMENTAGPRRAIETYQRILKEYPYYERNDQVLYQLSRAYDELGEVDLAVEVMERLARQYPNSEYLSEIYFRQGEYFFIRRKFFDAEDAYGAVVALGPDSKFYELALYKLGWTFYKQDLYEEALDHYVALLDLKLSQGYDFDTSVEDEGEEEDKRVADTFRVISLSFSNLGGAEVLNQFFHTLGDRSYEDRIYSNLAEFYVEKLRFNDAAEVYDSFVELNPLHHRAPRFSMRIAEVYSDGGFPKLVVQAKKDFAHRYGLSSEYWNHYDRAEMSDVIDYLQANLVDLAQHYHALYQVPELEEEKQANYAEALHWYSQYLNDFRDQEQAPSVNYQLADLHLEHERFDVAASEYERTAYDYDSHEKSSEAGYAAIFAHREHLKAAPESQQLAARQATVDSSLRFANTFPDHEHAAPVLGAAADDLYGMKQYPQTIVAGRQLIDTYPAAEPALLRSAWTVVSHSHFELAQYAEAEVAYTQLLTLVPQDDEEHSDLTENLAATIYKQGELANESAQPALAAEHFLRIQNVAPDSSIRPAAEYDAAVTLISLEDWSGSAEVLEAFRSDHPEHELQGDVTKQLALVYEKAGELSRSADEFLRIADEASQPELRSESLLQAGNLYRQAHERDAALAAYSAYVADFPEPLEANIETRNTIAELLLERNDTERYHQALQEIVGLDAQAGAQRTDRTRYLAANGALVLAEIRFEYFAEHRLTLPFDKSLAEKQRRMDVVMQAMEALPAYQVGHVTAAATYYIAETYLNFSNAMLNSERPQGLSGAELAEYDLVIEEEAYPFEEQAIEVHEANLELARTGIHGQWIERSLGQLAQLVPGQYAKTEISTGLLPSIDSYAYRSPIADQLEEETLTADADQTELLEVSSAQ